jgi:NAD(P)-dependent dehydrogenase (short-subunit alcohol dehydrogenase family)
MTSRGTAVVTGAARGLGRAIARRLSNDGYELLVLDRVEEGLAQTASEVGGRYLVLDVTDESGMLALADVAPETTLLVNNAAVTPFGSMLEISAADALQVFHVNVIGALSGARALAPVIERNGGGAIVNLSSITARSYPSGTSTYSLSKAAIEHLTRGLAVDLGPRGIRVNAVAPGTVPTEGTGAHYGGPDDLRRRTEVLPLRRLGTPADIAAAVSFLASEESGWITGQVLAVDGGYLASHGAFYRLARKGV